MLVRLDELRSEIELRNAQISDLQQKIMDADNGEFLVSDSAVYVSYIVNVVSISVVGGKLHRCCKNSSVMLYSNAAIPSLKDKVPV